MKEIFNAITNIVVNLEQNVFVGYDNFVKSDLSKDEIQKDIYNYCTNIVNDEFKLVTSVQSTIAQDTKETIVNNVDGKYIISYASIDSIELLDLDFSLGSIFTVYENSIEADSIKAVVYITYGPTFQLVYATKDDGVKYYSNNDGTFKEQGLLTLNEKGKINSTAGKVNEFSEQHQNLVQSFFNEGYRLRFSNSLSMDTHQILFKQGGIYSSPITKSNPNGILDVVFEAYPIAFVIELANGMAIDGKNRILDIKSPIIDQKTPIYFGSQNEIKKVLNQ